MTELEARRTQMNGGMVLFLAVLWAQLFAGCWPAWSAGTYYSYGFLVPAAAAVLFYRRNTERQIRKRSQRGAGEHRSVPGVALLWLLTGLGFLVFPFLRVVELVDSHWRLPLLIHASLVFLISHGWIWRLGGFRVSLALLPVSLFALTAVPLPRYFEDVFVERLTFGVIDACAGILPLAGIPVEVTGYAMESGGKVLQVDDGCSGIRSLQSLIMISLFFGELLRLSLTGRGILLLMAPALAFVFNTGRVLVLARERFVNGQAAYDNAHDWVGGVSFLLSALAMLGLAWMIAKWNDDAKRTYRVRTVGAAGSEA